MGLAMTLSVSQEVCILADATVERYDFHGSPLLVLNQEVCGFLTTKTNLDWRLPTSGIARQE